jgi:hypothetical protein
MNRCTGNKRDGTPCTLPAKAPSAYCWAHDPANADQRQKMAKKAGSASKTSQELRSLKQRLTAVGEDVLANRVNRANAAVAAQCWGVAVRAAEAEVKVRELESIKIPEFETLQAEVNELRALVEQQTSSTRRGGGSWAG